MSVRIILEVTGGLSAGTKIVVGQGQTAQVGRTNWADYSFPGDESMADVHFAILCEANSCRLRDLSGGKGVVVDGAKVIESELSDGDQLTAGETTFLLRIEGQSPPATEAADDSPSESTSVDPEPESAIRPKTAGEIVQQFELSEEARALLDDGMEPLSFFDLLCEQELFPDAMRFLAFWLPKPTVVTWGCQCVRETLGDQLPPEQERPIDEAEKWAADPTEENRRAAETAAESVDPAEMTGWVARAAFWSGGSLVAPELAPVPPDEGLTAQAVTGALLMAASRGDPTKTADRYRAFLAKGKSLIT
jgi:predicted component of type VI protein secretion system